MTVYEDEYMSLRVYSLPELVFKFCVSILERTTFCIRALYGLEPIKLILSFTFFKLFLTLSTTIDEHVVIFIDSNFRNRYRNARQLHLVVISVSPCNPVCAKVLGGIMITGSLRVWVRGEVSAFPSVFVCVEEVVVVLRRGLSGFVPEVPVEVFPHVLLVLRELEGRTQSAVGASSVRVGGSAVHSFVNLPA